MICLFQTILRFKTGPTAVTVCSATALLVIAGHCGEHRFHGAAHAGRATFTQIAQVRQRPENLSSLRTCRRGGRSCF